MRETNPALLRRQKMNITEPVTFARRTLPSPIGKIAVLAAADGIFAIDKAESLPPLAGQGEEAEDAIRHAEAGVRQLAEYFAGKRTSFALQLRPYGTPFQEKVWKELRKIPFGKTTSYGALAKAVGIPKGAHAVGGAVGKNPILIAIPCHRVLGADGSLTGYGAGLPAKCALLTLEGIKGYEDGING